MDVFDFTQLMQLSAAALVVVALWVVYYINKSKDAAMAAVLRVSVDTMTDTFKVGVASLRESQEGQRLFYQAKVDDLFKELTAERAERREEVVLLQKRITDLECELEEKNKRIETQGERIETLEDENTKLKSEVERLKGVLNSKQDKARKPEKQEKAA